VAAENGRQSGTTETFIPVPNLMARFGFGWRTYMVALYHISALPTVASTSAAAAASCRRLWRYGRLWTQHASATLGANNAFSPWLLCCRPMSISSNFRRLVDYAATCFTLYRPHLVCRAVSPRCRVVVSLTLAAAIAVHSAIMNGGIIRNSSTGAVKNGKRIAAWRRGLLVAHGGEYRATRRRAASALLRADEPREQATHLLRRGYLRLCSRRSAIQRERRGCMRGL